MPRPKFDDGFPPFGRHIPTLDCLRGAAILAVVTYHALGGEFAHYGSALGTVAKPFFWFTQWGFLGVHLFFVLSGFLITGILLDTRARPDYYRSFYQRRALRILPAMLLMLAIFGILHATTWKFLLAALFFVGNLALRYAGGPTSPASVLWTLGVEEQFYLLWPTVVRWLRPSLFLALSLGVIAASPLVRLHMSAIPPFYFTYKTWAVLDFFAAGAVLAMVTRSARLRKKMSHILGGLLMLSALLFAVQWFFIYRPGKENYPAAFALFFCPWVALFCAAVLTAFLLPEVAVSMPGRSFAFLGYISYGLYLCHTLVFSFVGKYWTIPIATGKPPVTMLLARFGVGFVLEIGLAWISRRTFEEFFLRRKPKDPRTPQAGATPVEIT